MENFTSAGLTSLLYRAIVQIAPDLVADIVAPDPMQRAVMPARQKAQLIDRLEKARGSGALFGIGQRLDLADETPTLAVLLRSSDTDVLAEKWMRLERYCHASHRTRILMEPGRWICRRESAARPATRGENCLVAGVLVGLVRSIGMTNCVLVVDGAVVDAEGSASATQLPSGRIDAFEIMWRLRPGEAPALPGPWPAPGGSLSDCLADLLSEDIARCWKLKDAARGLALSDRSLQRHLRSEGRSFSSCVRRARMREAVRLLADGNAPLAEIGYCCGYSDQAHFQRDFLRATNMTPRAFRAVAATGQA